MDSATKQTAIIAEATQGTTPATRAFKILRDIRVSGAPQRNDQRSPERRCDRMAYAIHLRFVTRPAFTMSPDRKQPAPVPGGGPLAVEI